LSTCTRSLINSAASLGGGQVLLRSTGQQFQQQLVDAVEQIGTGMPQLVAAVGEQPQRHRHVIGCHDPQALGSQRGYRHTVRVDRIRFAALPGGEYPHLGGELGGYVEHGLAVGDQPLGQVPADTVSALYRPQPLREPAAHSEHLPVAVLVSAEPARGQHGLALVDNLNRRRPLVRIHADDDASHVCLLASP
jgi:hypothetical protein